MENNSDLIWNFGQLQRKRGLIDKIVSNIDLY
jgi:hypothetical protein